MTNNSKQDQEIIVVETRLLFKSNYFQGFKKHTEFDFHELILNNMKIMKRGDAEKDNSHKQPIAYAIIVNKKTNQIFAYQRSVKDEDYKEKRLQGKWSWGVGGHIEKKDINDRDTIKKSLLREALKEEVDIIEGRVKNFTILGYINDDNNEVGRVHFGVLYLVETDGDVRPKDKEIAQGKFYEIGELENICSSHDFKVETWSQIALKPIKEYLDKL